MLTGHNDGRSYAQSSKRRLPSFGDTVHYHKLMQPCRADSMSLPYGTMTDEEMKAMPLAELQDDGGLLFLWVTGRAVSLRHRAHVHDQRGGVSDAV